MMRKYEFLMLPKVALILFFAIVLMSGCAHKELTEIDLAGDWHFQIDSLDKGIEEEWFAKSLDDTISLPGSMPEQGKGFKVGPDTKFTGHIWKQYPEGKSWMDDENYKPYFSEDEFRFPFWLISEYHYVGRAWYQREVLVPESWQGKTIDLYLERPHWETKVWVNGIYIGMKNALGVGHKYKVSDAMQVGKNTITISIDNSVKDIDVGGDSHSISDNTQSNWNGIVGAIELQKRDEIYIAQVNIYPDVENKTAQLQVILENTTNTKFNGELEIAAQTINTDTPHKVAPTTANFECDRGADTLVFSYAMSDDAQLWDEFNPNVYKLSLSLKANDFKDNWSGNFGMRSFSRVGKGFEINGRPTFLRGALDCAVFPKTGYPPTTVEPWERLLKMCKAHGLNHIRFHSWCPPKAAFDAADKLGFYFQVEASAWASILGDSTALDQWIYDESERMVAAYGNHPSFCMMPYGNEPHGKYHKEYLTNFVRYWKAKGDNRRIYSTAAGWPFIPENDFHNAHNFRIQSWNANLNSVINKDAPRCNYDWEHLAKDLKAPVVSHEIGQWCAYPNFKEIQKYDGVLKATNFEIFQASLKDKGLLHLAEDFLMASGKLQALCYKADIEAAMRTKGFGGFQLLDISDFSGQGTALVGVLDAFYEEKGYISPEEYKQFCNETTPLARFKQMIFTTDDTVACDVELAHYGPKELKGVTPGWQMIDKTGAVLRKGSFDKMDITWGHNIPLGSIREVIEVKKAQQFQLQVDVDGHVNTWDFWVYPAQLPEVNDDILITSTLNKAAISKLNAGGKVLLTVKKGSIKEGKGGEVAVGFSSIFWNTAWTNGQKPHTLGILCNPEHPALAEFPTEYHSNYQWWDAMSHSNAINIHGFKNKPEPIVRIIDDWVTNRNLAMVFEAKAGKGKLVMTGVDLQSDLDKRPEARQMLYSLKKYMAGEEFSPVTVLEMEEIKELFK